MPNCRYPPLPFLIGQINYTISNYKKICSFRSCLTEGGGGGGIDGIYFIFFFFLSNKSQKGNDPSYCIESYMKQKCKDKGGAYFFMAPEYIFSVSVLYCIDKT